MWRILRHQPAEIGDIGIGRLEQRRERQRRQRLTRPPDASHDPIGIGERGCDGMAAPETGFAGGGLGWSMAFTHGRSLFHACRFRASRVMPINFRASCR
jgi:hypothetical protein